MRAGSALLCVLACLASTHPDGAAAQTPDAAKTARIALATRYLTLSHRTELFRRSTKKPLQLSWTFCRDKPCQDDLDKAISDAVARGAERYEAHAIAVMAEHYTSGQLEAAIRFVSSPEGQAIVRINDQLADDGATLAHSLSLEIHKDVSKHFCPTHPVSCRAGPAARPARAGGEQGA